MKTVIALGKKTLARLTTSKPPLWLTYCFCCCCAVSVWCLAPRPDVNFSIINTSGTCQVSSNGEVELNLLVRLTFICSVCRRACRYCKRCYHEHFLPSSRLFGTIAFAQPWSAAVVLCIFQSIPPFQAYFRRFSTARTLLIPDPFYFSRGQKAPWTRRPRVIGKEMQRFSREKVLEAIDQACLLLQRILTRTRQALVSF